MAITPKLTPLRARVYDFIVRFKTEHDGVAPSFVEIGQACAINSTSAVHYCLIALVRLGMIEWEPGTHKSRMIAIPGGRWIPPTPSKKA